jgi:hypothetical protein
MPRGSNPRSHRNKPIVGGIGRLIKLSDEQWSLLKAIGNGKYSQGIRLLVQMHLEKEMGGDIGRPWVYNQTLKNINLPDGYWGEVTKCHSDGSLEITTVTSSGKRLTGQESVARQADLMAAGWQLIEFGTH